MKTVMFPVIRNVLSVGGQAFLLELGLRVYLNPISITWSILQSCPVKGVMVKGLYIAHIIERRIEDEENSSYREQDIY